MAQNPLNSYSTHTPQMERLQRLAGRLSRSASKTQITLRELELDDYHKGFCELMGQLTTCGDYSFEKFRQQFERRRECYRTVVIEDIAERKVIASATLLIEDKFVHNCGRIGHVEDVVVNTEYRGLRLGFRVVDQLIKWGREVGCYKIILDCSEKNVKFYEKLGFQRKEVQMAIYF